MPGDCIDRVTSRTEIEYFSNDCQHQGHNPRSRWRVIGKQSSRSSLISRMMFRASGNSVLPGKSEQECETIRDTPRSWECNQAIGATHFWSGGRNSSHKKKNSLVRKQKRSKELKLVQTKFVFEKTSQKRRWWSAKNPSQAIFKRAMWNSLNWRNQRSNAHHAYTMYLKEQSIAIAASYWSSTRARSTELRKPSRSWKHHSVHLRIPQEVPNAARIHGRCITPKLETHYEALQKRWTRIYVNLGQTAKWCDLQAISAMSIICRMLGFDTWTTLYTPVSSVMLRHSKERTTYAHTCIYAVLTITDRHHLCRRDPRYREATEHLKEIYNKRKEKN